MASLLQIAGEIIIKQFDAETLSIITHIPMETEVERDDSGNIVKATVGTIDLIRDLREKEPVNVTINIQTDSTILDDIEADRSALREAITALSEYGQIAPVLTPGLGGEASAKIAINILEKYKLGRDIQQDVRDHLDQMLANPPEPQPDPIVIQAQEETKRKEMDIQFQQNKAQMDAIVKAADFKIKVEELRLQAEEMGIDTQINIEKLNLEALDKMIKLEALEVEASEPGNTVVGA